MKNLECFLQTTFVKVDKTNNFLDFFPLSTFGKLAGLFSIFSLFSAGLRPRFNFRKSWERICFFWKIQIVFWKIQTCFENLELFPENLELFSENPNLFSKKSWIVFWKIQKFSKKKNPNLFLKNFSKIQNCFLKNLELFCEKSWIVF